jgi:hypothetical protein
MFHAGSALGFPLYTESDEDEEDTQMQSAEQGDDNMQDNRNADNNEDRNGDNGNKNNDGDSGTDENGNGDNGYEDNSSHSGNEDGKGDTDTDPMNQDAPYGDARSSDDLRRDDSIEYETWETTIGR